MSTTLKKVFLITLLMLLAACGGGTQGTGGEIIKGYVHTSTNEPVRNVTVRLAHGDEFAVTQNDGSFSIETSSLPDRLEVGLQGEFAGKQFDLIVLVYDGEIPAGTNTIDVIFGLFLGDGGVTPVVLDIEYS